MTFPVQVIHRAGLPVAVTVGSSHAILDEHLVGEDLRLAQAMCAYALEVAAGERPGPYRDEDAARYASALLALDRKGLPRHRSRGERGCDRSSSER